MPKLALLLPFLFIAQLATSQHQPLFKITVNGKTGFIDSTGTTVIPPIYHNAFDFREGLAAVRENELYGFIDFSGKYVLAPQFDYATYFENGITLVYKQRQPYFIDKTGKVILPTVYRSIEFINTRKAVIATKSQRYGIIDIPTNRLLLDTLYSQIHFYNSGVTVVSLFDSTSEKYGLRPHAAIDTSGNFIVPFGKYDYIKDFHNGFAEVIIDTNYTPGIIDVTGKLINKEHEEGLWDMFNSFPNGYYTFHGVSSGGQIYEGLIDPTGDTIVNNPNYKSVSSFSCNRIVVEDHNEDYFILDCHAKQVSNRSFDRIMKFFKNYAIVKSGGCYGIIDTTGKVVIPPTYEDIVFPDSTADHFFFGVPDKQKDYGKIYGLANMNNQIIVQPEKDYPENKAFVNGLYNTTVNNLSTYINQQGKIVWQEPVDNNQTAIPLNIDYLGYSQYRDYPETLIRINNGDSSYVVLLGKLITAADHLPNNKFIFQFDTTQGYSSNGFKTYKLIVGNSTNEAIKLLRISGLIILLEALDEDGIWKKIEIIGYPTHTNGYDDIVLNPGKFWPFIVAQYAGSFPTKLRAALWYLDKNEKVQTIYSNVIKTNINRTQFWREYEYPTGVSDPHRWNRSIDLSTIKRDNWGQWNPIYN